MQQGPHLSAQGTINQRKGLGLPRIRSGYDVRFRHPPHELLQLIFRGSPTLYLRFRLLDHLIQQTARSKRDGRGRRRLHLAGLASTDSWRELSYGGGKQVRILRAPTDLAKLT